MKLPKATFVSVLIVAIVSGCAHMPSCQPSSIPAEGSPKAIENNIKILQQEVDVLAKQLRREQLHLVESENSVLASGKTNAPDVQDLTAIQNSLERQKKALLDEIEATSHVGRPF